MYLGGLACLQIAMTVRVDRVFQFSIVLRRVSPNWLCSCPLRFGSLMNETSMKQVISIVVSLPYGERFFLCLLS